jgi:hypothetical protein
MEVETVEGDSVIFLEDDEADYLYVIMSGSVGVHIHDKKHKELMKAARAESQSAEDAAEDQRRMAEKEALAQSKHAAVARAIEDDVEEPPPKSEDELLAEQMQRDAEAEVARLMKEKEEQKKKSRESEDESEEDSDDDDEQATPNKSPTHSVPTAVGARLQASSRGDVFTASGAGQYALARKLRGHSISVGAGNSDALAHIKKAEAEEFKRKMAAAAGAPSDEHADDEGALERQLSEVLAGGADTGRTQCGHLNAAERTEQFGPCVVQLPSGSVVPHAGQRNRRTATIITMEPTFFIKLHGDVVSRLTFGRAASSGGSMSQDAMANFLKTLDILRIVKGSATGAGTGLDATFKRLAYHMKDRNWPRT